MEMGGEKMKTAGGVEREGKEKALLMAHPQSVNCLILNAGGQSLRREAFVYT